MLESDGFKAVIHMKNAVKILILITAVMLMISLFGCGKNKQFDIETYKDAQENTMLLDYYERTVGTPEEQPYYEMVLYTYSDTRAKLEEYAEGGTDHETLTTYLIPLEGAQEMLTAVKDCGMADWNRREGIAVCGKAYVCKFPDGKGDYIRVTSDNMPEDGAKRFGTVYTAMRKWMRDEYRTE